MTSNPPDDRGQGSFFAIAKCVRGGGRFSGILLKNEPLPGENEVGGHDRGKHYILPTWYVLPQHSVVSGAMLFYHVSYERNRSYDKGAFRSDL